LPEVVNTLDSYVANPLQFLLTGICAFLFSQRAVQFILGRSPTVSSLSSQIDNKLPARSLQASLIGCVHRCVRRRWRSQAGFGWSQQPSHWVFQTRKSYKL